MSVLYFKDIWRSGNKDICWDPLVFRNADGTRTKVLAFEDSGKYYLDGNNAKGFVMPFYGGFEFVAVLPNSGVSIKNVDLTPFIEDTVKHVEADVHFVMSGFEVSSTYSVKLSDMELSEGVIDPEYCQEDLSDQEITHVARISVNNAGAEAAAVTTMELIAASEAEGEQVKKYIDIICDRPFYFFIRDTANGDIAFMGIVNTMAE